MFENCKAGKQGGAVYTKQQVFGNDNAEYAKFSYCIAVSGGGAIRHENNTLDSVTAVEHIDFDHCYMPGETDSDSGGAISSLARINRMTHCNFYECRSKQQGGAVFQYLADSGTDKASKKNGVYTATNCRFTSCEAGAFSGTNSRAGGASEIQAKTVTVTGCEFTDCIAADIGGAILVWKAKLTVSGGTITGNSVTTSDKKTAYGGAIHVSTTGEIILTGGEISGNEAQGGSAKGGGVSVQGGTANISGNVLINNNTASRSSTNNASYGAYGGGVHVEFEKNRGAGSLILSGGTITNNTCIGRGKGKTNGAGILVNANCSMEISGSPDFGGQGFAANGNYLTINGYSDKKNGNESYPAGNKVRQDIYLAGKAGSGANLQSLKVTDDLTGPEGSIWVWAEAQEHYMKDMQFAILDHTGINGLKVFRNACDDVSTSGGVLTEYLFGTLSNSDNTRLLVYWGESVKGTRKVILRKMDRNYTPAKNKTFTVYMGSNTNAYLANLKSLDSGVFWIGKLPYGWYIIEETTPHKFFYLVVTAEGTYGTSESAGGYATRNEAETKAKAVYSAHN